MKHLFFPLIALFIPLVAPGQTHCQKDETDYFSCQVKGGSKVISLCGGHLDTARNENSWLQYRFGNLGEIEMAYPQREAGSLDKFEGNYFNPHGEDHDVISLRFIALNALFDVSLAEYPQNPRISRLQGGVSVDAGKKSSYHSCQQPIRPVYLSRFRELYTLLPKPGATDFMSDFYRRKGGAGG